MLKILEVKFDGMKPAWVKEQGLSLSSLDDPLERPPARLTCTDRHEALWSASRATAAVQGSDAGGSWIKSPLLICTDVFLMFIEKETPIMH